MGITNLTAFTITSSYNLFIRISYTTINILITHDSIGNVCSIYAIIFNPELVRHCLSLSSLPLAMFVGWTAYRRPEDGGCSWASTSSDHMRGEWVRQRCRAQGRALSHGWSRARASCGHRQGGQARECSATQGCIYTPLSRCRPRSDQRTRLFYG
jgi:hypothetical protein